MIFCSKNSIPSFDPAKHVRASIITLTLLALAALALIFAGVTGFRGIGMATLGYQVSVSIITTGCTLLAISGLLSIYFMKCCHDANLETLSGEFIDSEM